MSLPDIPGPNPVHEHRQLLEKAVAEFNIGTDWTSNAERMTDVHNIWWVDYPELNTKAAFVEAHGTIRDVETIQAYAEGLLNGFGERIPVIIMHYTLPNNLPTSDIPVFKTAPHVGPLIATVKEREGASVTYTPGSHPMAKFEGTAFLTSAQIRGAVIDKEEDFTPTVSRAIFRVEKS